MTEKDDNDSKVIPLFPGKESGGQQESQRSAAPDPQPKPEDPDTLRQAIQGLLGEAEPIPPSAPDKPQAPEPGHRNAMRCPQCDQYTWRLTQHCIHCGADLFADAEERAYLRRRRRHIIVWCGVVTSWVVAAGCIYAYNEYYRSLPPKVRGILVLVGGGIIAVNLFLFWITSSDDERR
jgi:hypothetical protein